MRQVLILQTYSKKLIGQYIGDMRQLVNFVSMNEVMQKLDDRFYNRTDVQKIARELLGKILVTEFNHVRTSGRIVETEAYAGTGDRASHAFGGRRTARTEIMYSAAGVSYVYLCYGIHHLFNIITNKKDIPHAILIRALEPIEGIDTMLERTGKAKPDHTLTRGPGNLSKAMGISTKYNGRPLSENEIYVLDDGFRFKKNEIAVTKRIGVEYAREDAERLYRYAVKGNKYVSGTRT